MESFDRFATTYLAQWERHATVRAARRYVLDGDVTGEALFPVTLQPLCDVPAVAARGADARRFVLIQSCYHFMEEIALLETDVVVRLAGDVANRSHRVELSPAVRQVALTVAVDEAYHAFAAREFIEQVREATGVAPMERQVRCQLTVALAAAQAVTPTALHDELGLVALCVAENSITQEVLGMTQEAVAGSPFHTVSAEHMVDEGRHSGYFQLLLRHYWAALDETTRTTLGGVLPVFLESFLMDGAFLRAHARALLREIGLDADTIDRMMAEAAARPFERMEHPMAQNVFRLFERSGVLDHAPTREAFERHGWLVPAARPRPTG